jgi:hypothetical protein
MTATKLNPQQFSEYGDQLFNQLLDRFPESKKWRLLMAEALSPERFAQVRFAAATYISACLGSKKTITDETELLDAIERLRGTMPNITPNGLLMPKREFVLEFNLLHKSIAGIFKDFQIDEMIETMHVPVNLRIAQGTPKAAVDSRAYATNKMHSDVWAGEPLDAVIVHLPLFGDAENIGIDFCEMTAAKEQQFMRILKDYDEGKELFEDMKRYDCTMKLGNIYFADARLLHATMRKKPGLRVSLDFRFRMRSEGPYRAAADEILKAGRQPNYFSFPDFCRIGSDDMMAFDETCDEARQRHTGNAPAKVEYAAAYRIVKLFPD